VTVQTSKLVKANSKSWERSSSNGHLSRWLAILEGTEKYEPLSSVCRGIILGKGRRRSHGMEK
jgi:hypothetical protein